MSCAAAVLAVGTRLVGDGADGGEGVEVEEVVEGVGQRDPHVGERLAHRLPEDGHDLLGPTADGRDRTEDQRQLHHLGHAAARDRVQAVSEVQGAWGWFRRAAAHMATVLME